MANVLVEETTLKNIADAIREVDSTTITSLNEANATSEDILEGNIGYVNGTKIEGTGVEESDKRFYNMINKNIDVIIDNDLNHIRFGAFLSCLSLQYLALFNCDRIYTMAFAGCTNLKAVNLPNTQVFYNSVFSNCQNLSIVSAPAATKFSAGCFSGCYRLMSISAPSVTTLGAYAFYQCSSLRFANLSLVRTIGSNCFSNCYNLLSMSLRSCWGVASYAFYNCSKLHTVDLSNASTASGYISASAFQRCFKLSSLYLRHTTRCYTLQHSNALQSTPCGNYSASNSNTWGKIYVPNARLASYKAATNWTYYSARFVSI